MASSISREDDVYAVKAKLYSMYGFEFLVLASPMMLFADNIHYENLHYHKPIWRTDLIRNPRKIYKAAQTCYDADQFANLLY